MNDQQIYQLLARKPDARAQDIADKLDVDLKDTSAALKTLVDVGDVVRHTGTAPNSLPTQLYNLSDAFKRTKDGVAALAAAAGFKDAAPAAKPAPVVDPEAAPPAPVAIPVFVPVEQPKVSRSELGIAYVTKHGRVTQEALRKAMDMKHGEYPSAFLGGAIRAGKLYKDNTEWVAGPSPAHKAASKFNFSKPPKDEPKAQFKPTEQPDEPAPAAAAPEPSTLKSTVVNDVFVSSRDAGKFDAAVAAIAAPVPTVPVFRCGLWSDGVLELQRNGLAIAMLTRGEHEHMADFMRRMLGTVEQVAA